MSSRQLTAPLAAIALVSAAALAYEILLTRLFSIIQWHHFAYLIISVALLGYGASGTFLSLAQRPLLARFETAFVALAATFGITEIAAFLLAQYVPFNALELLWNPNQAGFLFVLCLLLSTPFLFAGACVGLSFARFRVQTSEINGWGMIGAGAGCLLIVSVLFLVQPMKALMVTGAVAFLGAAAASAQFGMRHAAWIMLGAGILIPALPSPALKLSEYKELSRALQIKGAHLAEQRSSPLGLISAVENKEIPLRYAPGLSLNSYREPPPQIALFTDGDSMSVLDYFDWRRPPLAYLDYLTSALPYRLLENPRVLVLGAGAGSDVLQAVYEGAESIDAVELNPQMIDLVRRKYGDYSGHIYSTVRVLPMEARGYVSGTSEQYDLIQVALLDSFSTSAAGLYALSESYLYTVEAFEAYLARLRPDGLLAITRWVSLPPRDALKLFATALTALEKSGQPVPPLHLALIRGWQTTTLLVKNGTFSQTDVAAMQEFCRTRAFDIDYDPYTDAQHASRFNVLAEPYFSQGSQALIGPKRQAFMDNYKFNIAPATDDQPYFFHFFKWRSLPEILSLKGKGGLSLLELGYPVLVATLGAALLASAALILLPLYSRRARLIAVPGRGRVAAYFTAIGLSFMFVEIAFIQKFVLFLSHPLYAVSVVLCSFLLFAGLGSHYSGRPRAAVLGAMPLSVAAVGTIVLIVWLYIMLFPPLIDRFMWLPESLRNGLSVAHIAPLAFAMGMPFPLALSAVGDDELVPWAWAINGCASVVGAVLAAIIAVHFGFTAVLAAAAIIYLASLVVFPGREAVTA